MQKFKSTAPKILHITNWYPNPWHAHEGIFIKNQLDAFSEISDSAIVNIQSRKSETFFTFCHKKYNNNEEGVFILSSTPWQRLHEFFTTILLIYVLFKKKANEFDLIHVHIAYPLLVHYWILKYIIKKPILISEHWSAYHYNFYLEHDNKNLNSIKSIFRNKLPLITVSKSLLNDITRFSGTFQFNNSIIPNFINDVFLESEILKNLQTTPTFFTVNLWRDIKNPFPMLKAFALLSSSEYDFNLIIGGYGPLLEKMVDYVKSSSLAHHTQFLGKMDSHQICESLKISDAYLFSSEYETFSVACAQALCTGTPLIGPMIDAISEYATPLDWKVVEQNDVNNWYSALVSFIENRFDYNHENIANRARTRFNKNQLKSQYLDIITKLIKN